MPGAHKIGAAISGPRITGGNFMDTTLFLNKKNAKEPNRPNFAPLQGPHPSLNLPGYVSSPHPPFGNPACNHWGNACACAGQCRTCAMSAQTASAAVPALAGLTASSWRKAQHDEVRQDRESPRGKSCSDRVSKGTTGREMSQQFATCHNNFRQSMAKYDTV